MNYDELIRFEADIKKRFSFREGNWYIKHIATVRMNKREKRLVKRISGIRKKIRKLETKIERLEEEYISFMFKNQIRS